MRYIGGGPKRKDRIIDFLRDKGNFKGEVPTLKNGPNPSPRIAHVNYVDGGKR